MRLVLGLALALLLAAGCSNSVDPHTQVPNNSSPAGSAGVTGQTGADMASGGALGSAGGGAASVSGAGAGGSAAGNASGAAALGGNATGSGGVSGAAGATGGGGGDGGVGGMSLQPPKASGLLCVFDYDLTLSTNNCVKEQYACRTNTCLTYNWYQQCMSSGARHAIEVCVERGAFIGIASHASVDACWDDKVSVIISQQQFPALTEAARYDNPGTDFSYPKIDQRSNWNCDNCAYHMNGAFSKPQLISKIMTHYGLDPKSAVDRAKVIFWDDLPDNISKTNADMPEVHTVHVHENIDGQPNSGGCGILESDITAGWAPFPK